jgi:hypothetical protein
MKHLLYILLIFISFSVAAQNTRLVFSDAPSNSDFDGDQISFYDPQANKDAEQDDVRPYEKYYANGELAESGLIVNNKPEGVWKKFDQEGKLIGKTKYKDGKKTGKWVIWNYDGSVLAKGRYNSDGEKTGNWIYYSSVEHKYLQKSF